MIFVALLTGLFVLRLAFRMTGSLLMIGLVILVLSDEARLHPSEARQVWEAISGFSAELAQFAQRQSGSVDRMPAQQPALNRSKPAVGYY